MSKWVEQETKRAQKSNLYQSTIKYCTQRDCFGFDSAILNFVFSCLFVTSRAKVEMDIAEDREIAAMEEPTTPASISID